MKLSSTGKKLWQCTRNVQKYRDRAVAAKIETAFFKISNELWLVPKRDHCQGNGEDKDTFFMKHFQKNKISCSMKKIAFTMQSIDRYTLARGLLNFFS